MVLVQDRVLDPVESVLDSPVLLEPGGDGRRPGISVMGREQSRVDHSNMLLVLDSLGTSDLGHLGGCGNSVQVRPSVALTVRRMSHP